jgi:hypothetical protein
MRANDFKGDPKERLKEDAGEDALGARGVGRCAEEMVAKEACDEGKEARVETHIERE